MALSPLRAQEVYPFAYQGKWGVVDKNGQVTMPPALDTISFFTPPDEPRPLAVARKGGKVGLITSTGTWVLKPTADSIGYDLNQEQPLRWVMVGGKYGLLNVGGKKPKWVVKPTLDEVGYFQGGEPAMAVVRKGSGWGVLNVAGKFIVPCVNEEVEILWGDGMERNIRVVNQEVVTYFANDGTALPESPGDSFGLAFMDESVYDESYPSAEYRTKVVVDDNGQAKVLLSGKVGHQDWKTLKQVIVPPNCEVKHVEYRETNIFHILVTRGGKFGFISDAGEIITEPIHDSISWVKPLSDFSVVIALLHQGNRVGAAKYNGRQILPPDFTRIYTWGDDSMIVATKSNWLIVHTPNGYQGFAKFTGEVFLPSGWKE